jgi:hypothetical protein
MDLSRTESDYQILHTFPLFLSTGGKAARFKNLPGYLDFWAQKSGVHRTQKVLQTPVPFA